MSKKSRNTTLPADADPKPVEEKKVTLSQAVVRHYRLGTKEAVLVEQGEVESVVKVEGQTYVVGNEEVA